MSRLLKRTLLVLPFVIAAALQLLGFTARPLGWRLERISGYAFLWFPPWAWLLDRGWLDVRNKAVEAILAYVVLLWIPALLYSLCLWSLLKAFSKKNKQRTNANTRRLQYLCA